MHVKDFTNLLKDGFKSFKSNRKSDLNKIVELRVTKFNT